MQPTIGRIVHYKTDGRGGLNYELPAMIVRTAASSDPSGPLPELGENEVDLFVMSVDGASYGESGVAHADVADDVKRSWHWPERD